MREILAIGVISGTSADGIDAAALLTDGVQVTRTLGGVTVPYAEDLRAEVLSLMAAPERVREKEGRQAAVEGAGSCRARACAARRM